MQRGGNSLGTFFTPPPASIGQPTWRVMPLLGPFAYLCTLVSNATRWELPRDLLYPPPQPLQGNKHYREVWRTRGGKWRENRKRSQFLGDNCWPTEVLEAENEEGGQIDQKHPVFCWKNMTKKRTVTINSEKNDLYPRRQNGVAPQKTKQNAQYSIVKKKNATYVWWTDGQDRCWRCLYSRAHYNTGQLHNFAQEKKMKKWKKKTLEWGRGLFFFCYIGSLYTLARPCKILFVTGTPPLRVIFMFFYELCCFFFSVFGVYFFLRSQGEALQKKNMLMTRATIDVRVLLR